MKSHIVGTKHTRAKMLGARVTALIVSAATLFTIASCGSASTSGSAEHPDWPAKISLAQMPNENNPAADTKTKEFAEALSKDLGIEVEGFDAAEYSTAIEGMASKKVDVMMISPMSYFQAKERAGAELLVSTPTASDYHTVFITKSDRKDINTLEDLRGKSFAFVDQASSSGYLYPKGELVKKLKLDPEKIESSGYFFSTVAFSGNHTTSAKGVSMGDYDAAAVAAQVLTQMETAKQLDAKSIKIIDKTATIPNPAYVVRGDLPADLKTKIRDFFLSYDNKDYFKTVYGSEKIKFVKVSEKDYAPAEEILKLLKIDMGDQ